MSGLGAGLALDADVRASMESRFGHDFSRVRVHVDQPAAEAADALAARAFTWGSHIVFGAGSYAPRTPLGVRLLSHELTHVVQQSRGGGRAEASVSHPSDPAEREASHLAERVALGETVAVRQAGAGIQRYGHFVQECEDDLDLKPHIWPGHHLAMVATGNAIQLLNQNPLQSIVKTVFLHYFKEIGRLATVRSKLEDIQTALTEQYMYHCHADQPVSGQRTKKDKRCAGTQAYMNNVPDPWGTGDDIVLCMNKVRNFSTRGVARLIIHENSHRKGVMMTGFHPACNDPATGECGSGSSAMLACGGPTEDVLNSADSYACLVERLSGVTP